MKIRETLPLKFSPSKTKPGQALIPAELLKRHLAGTLPDIAKVPQYTHDDEGHQISEDLSGMELHELHDLAMRLKHEYAEREKQLAKKAADDYKQSIIDEHTRQNPDPTPGPDTLNPQGPTQNPKAKSASLAKGRAEGNHPDGTTG